METVNNAQSAQAGTTGRLLTKTRVAGMLSAAIIPNKGSNKLPIIGRGNTVNREDGTQVRIFNVAAFADMADAQAAAKYFQDGMALEDAGDLDGAQQHYRSALNRMMNFSVREENAADFATAFEINCIIDDVPVRNRDAQGNITEGYSGETKLGINQPRPVAVTRSGQNVGNMFALPKPTGSTPSSSVGSALRNELNQSSTDIPAKTQSNEQPAPQQLTSRQQQSAAGK